MVSKMMKYCPNLTKITSSHFSTNVRRSSTTNQANISHPLNYYVDLNERKSNVAFVDYSGPHTYGDLSNKSKIIAKNLKENLGSKCDQPNKISFLCENDCSYVNTLLGIWKAGQVAVPLCKAHPTQTLEY